MTDQEKLNDADTVCRLIEVLTWWYDATLFPIFLYPTKSVGMQAPYNICILHYWSYQCLILYNFKIHHNSSQQEFFTHAKISPKNMFLP